MKKFTFVIFTVFLFSLLPGLDNQAYAHKHGPKPGWKPNKKNNTGAGSLQSSASKNQTSNKKPKDNKKGHFANLVKSTPVEDINLRPAVQVERAVAKYVLAFEAYNEAKKSENPDVRARTAEYLRNYRESYAEFLKMMRNDNLYDPKMPKDMAGDYNRKHFEVKNEEREWSGDGLKNVSDYVKKEISAGGDPKMVASYIEDVLPIEPLSYAPSDSLSGYSDLDDDLLNDGSFDQGPIGGIPNRIDSMD
ncbi:MAG: hypothetical protein BWY02_00832 [bacterium ADurb.Bin157]|nr:MAG: hypothetical protein BWY02_00832 [bacterium ADurb.Bin157]